MTGQGRCAAVVSDAGLGGIRPLGALLREAGVSPLLLTGDAPAHRLAQWRRLYDVVTVIGDPYDPDALARAALDAAGGRRLCGLFSGFDGQIVPAAVAARQLGLAHPSLDGLRRARNKYATRLASREHGLPTPRFALARCREDCARAADDVGLPAVIKPLNGLAGHLVQRAGDPSALAAAYDRIAERILHAFPGMYGRPLEIGPRGGDVVDARTTFLVEELMTGREYSAEVVVRGGKVDRVLLLHKFLVDPVTYFEQGFTWPPFDTGAAEEEAIWQLIEDTLHALGVDDTVGHVEVMLTAAGPRIIEVNAGRPGGQIIALLPPRVSGVDMAGELVALQCGLDPPARTVPDPPARVATLTVFPDRGGTLKRVRGLDAVRRLDGVEAVVTGVKPGDHLDPDDLEIFAVNLLVTGIGERERLVALHEQARRLVSFEMAGEPGNGAR